MLNYLGTDISSGKTAEQQTPKVIEPNIAKKKYIYSNCMTKQAQLHKAIPAMSLLKLMLFLTEEVDMMNRKMVLVNQNKVPQIVAFSDVITFLVTA